MDHAGYLATVVAAIRDEHLTVEDLELHDRPHRSATVTLGRSGADFAFTDLTRVTAGWGEHDGWSLQLHTQHRQYTLHRGHDLAPIPQIVAAWIALALTQPDLVVDRSHERPLTDPDLGARLARYSLSI